MADDEQGFLSSMGAPAPEAPPADGKYYLNPGPYDGSDADPSLWQRFKANFGDANRNGAFIARGIYRDDWGHLSTSAAAAQAAYGDMPQWETPLEGAAALSGQLLGSLADPSSIAMGVEGLGAKGLTAAGRYAPPIVAKSPAWMARFFAGAIDAGAANTLNDALVQTAKMQTGEQEKGFDLGELGGAATLGVVLGGVSRAVGGNAHAAGDVRPQGEEAPIVEQSQPSAASTSDVPATAPVETAPKPVPESVTDALRQNPDAALGDVLDQQARDARGLTPRPTVPDAPQISTPPEIDPATAVNEGQPLGTFMFDPRQLAVDADRFQFKSDGDAKGVTSALKGVNAWLPERGNQLMVWQDKDGQNFVVDGHQRTGLARRLLDQGMADDIQVPGVLYREADGFTPEDVTAKAALKNIAEGSASPIDGAKVLRALGPEALDNMPMSREGARASADLSHLDDEAFRMVTNGVVDPADAKYVGRFIPNDPERQVAALKALKVAEPANEDEAAMLVRRVAEAELTKGDAANQGDMFGVGPDSTVIQETKIVAGAVRQMKSDGRLFGQVGRNADRIETTGSSLARDGLMAAKEQAERGGLAVEKEAFRAGPVRDKLKQLASEVKNGQRTLSEARSAFIEHVRSTKESIGEGSGGQPGREPAGAGDATKAASQSEIAGTAPAGDAAMAQRAADAPLRATQPQNLEMGEGLFGDSHLQKPLFSAPVGEVRGKLGRGGVDPSDVAMTRLKDVGDDLVEALKATGVRQGRLSAKLKPGMRVMGQYDPRSGMVRVRNVDDFETLAHELGHHLEDVLGDDVRGLMQQHADELKPMAYEGANKDKLLEEGFAEFMRSKVTNPAYAERQAPRFNEAFDAMMAEKHPDLQQALNRAADGYSNWLTQPSDRAVASTIVSSERPGWAKKLGNSVKDVGLGETIAERSRDFYTAMVDDLNPLSRLVNGLLGVAKENSGKMADITADKDAYKLARMAKGYSNAAMTDLMNGVTPYRRPWETPSSSFRDALVMAQGSANALSKWKPEAFRDFGSYLWSRRALGEWDRYEQGIIPNRPDKLTKGDHQQNVAELEKRNPQYKAAAALVYDHQKAMLQKKMEAGLITREQFDAAGQIKDYVPGLRAFDQSGDGKVMARKTPSQLKSAMLKRFMGSNRDVINPLESIMADAFDTHAAIARNDAIRAIANMADMAGPGSGRFAERIPASEMKGTTFDMIEAVRAAAKEAGLSDTDYISLRDAVETHLGADAKGTLMKPSTINEKGEPIAFFREAGELKALRLPDGKFGADVVASLSAMTERERSQFERLLMPLTKIAALKRIAVTANPAFLPAIFIKDQMLANMLYGKPLTNFTGAMKGAAAEVMQKEAAILYNRFGGPMGGVAAHGAREAQGARSLDQMHHKGWAAKTLTSLEGVAHYSEVSETASRLSLFNRFYQEGIGRGLDKYSAYAEAAWQSRDYMDYDRRGSMTGPLARVVPFLNAHIQGFTKILHTFAVTPYNAGIEAASKAMPDHWAQAIAPLFREAVTQQDMEQRAMSLKAWAYLAGATVLGTSLHALFADNSDYQDMDPRIKADNWVFKLGGTWYRVPKPFQLSAILNTGPAAYDAMKIHNPRWAENYLDGLHVALMPPDVMSSNPLVKTGYEWRVGKDLDTGRSIVPPSTEALQPFMQANHWNSQFAVDLGKAMNKSPAWIDQLNNNFAGPLGRMGASLYDYAASDKPTQGWQQWPILQRFTKDAYKGTQSSTAFWNQVGQGTGALEGARRTYQSLMAQGDVKGASDFMATQPAAVKEWVALGTDKPETRALYPYENARRGVSAISGLLKDMQQSKIPVSGGSVTVDPQTRGAAQDILEKWSAAKAHNALIAMGHPDWQGMNPIPTDGYQRELEAVSPDLSKALADRMATNKVYPDETVAKLWPELKTRLDKGGGQAYTDDLGATAKAFGYAMGGAAMKRAPRAIYAPPMP